MSTSSRRVSIPTIICVLALCLGLGCPPKPQIRITVTPSPAPVAVGATVQLTATSTDAADTTWEWSVQNAAVATVSNTGLVTGVAVGSTTVTARGLHSNKTGSTTVNVTAPPGGSVLGWVRDGEGAALPGVAVTTGAASTHSDSFGMFLLEGVPVGERVINCEKEGYTSNSVIVQSTAGGMATVNVALLRLEDPTTINAAAGGTAEDADGNKVTFAPGSLVNKATGRKAEGDVDVSVTALDINDTNELAAFPGEFRAAATKAGETVQLETFALADFTVTSNGAKLDLKQGATAQIELRLPEDTTLQLGEQVPLWSFDEAQGLWIDQGMGTVQTASDDTSALAWFAEVPHLSWWNCDRPITEKHCLTGRVLDENGAPVANAQVTATGLDYDGVSYDVTDANGEYCVDVKNGSRVRVDVKLPGGNVVVDTVEVVVPADNSSCATGGCTEVEDLRATFDSCVSGVVRDEAGQPIPNATVRTSTGSVATTDQNGNFCIPTPADIDVAVFVLGRPAVLVHTPVAGACGSGACAEAILAVDYPEDGDFVGVITAMVNDYNVWVPDPKAMEIVRGLSAFAFFFSSATDAPYDYENIVEDECTYWELDTQPDTEEPGDDPFTGLEETIGALDPGAPGTVTNGAAAGQLPRLSDIMAEAGSPYITPMMYGMFTLDDAPLAGFDFGDSLDFAWPGGLDIGPFTCQVAAPSQLVVTSPVLTPGVYGGYTVDLDLTQALNIAWQPGDGDAVTVSITSMTYGKQQFQASGIRCVLIDDGAHTIPASLLQQLPQGAGQQFLSFSISRLNMQVCDVPLTHGGTGSVIGYGLTSITAQGNTQLPKLGAEGAID